MKKLLILFLLSIGLQAQTALNVQKGGPSGPNNITADLNIASGRTLTIASGGTLNATAGTFSLSSGQVSAFLDQLGSTRGSVLYKGASGWTILPPGTVNFVLQTGGAGADPSWVAQSGGGGVWGTITGTLSNQTDLQNALNLKANLISPSFTTPTLGVATATSINGNIFTTGTGTLTLAAGKTLTASNTLTFAGTDGSTLNIGTGGTLLSAAFTASSSYLPAAAINLATGGSGGVTGTLPFANGGLGITTGASGGVPYFSSTSTIASSSALTQNAIMLGGGAGAAPSIVGSLGTSTTVLHGNSGGAPAFSQVSLTADVTGTLGVANAGTGITTTTPWSPIFSGTSATGAWKADTGPGTTGQVLTSNGASNYPTWQNPTGGVSASGTPTSGQVAVWTSASAIQGVTPTGTGTPVFSTGASLSAPTFSGIVTSPGANVTAAAAMGALAIDVTKTLNTKTISAGSTFTFSSTPSSADTWFSMLVVNSDTLAHAVVIPSSLNMNAAGVVTTGYTMAAGEQDYLTWHYDGTNYHVWGIPGVGYAPEITVASATTTDLGAANSVNVAISGTTTITSLGSTANAGTFRQGRFSGALTLTHNATNLILPNAGGNITTAAGDTFGAVSSGSGNWRILWYQKADGTSLQGSGGGAPVGATYITQTPDSTLTSEQALSLLSTGLMVSTTSTGVVSTVAAPSGTVVGTTDSQTLTNKTLTTPTIGSFTNATHTHTNAAGGGQLAEAALALTDVTTNNVTTSAHGFAPKLPNDATKYLDGTGNFSVPAGSGGGGNNSALFTSTADATNNATASDTSIVGTGVGSKTTAANYFAAGTSLLIEASGYYSSAAVPDTLNIKLKAGSTSVGTTGTFTPAATQTNQAWRVIALVTCRTAGASGTFQVNTIFETTTATLANTDAKVINTSNVTLDTTGTLAWDLTALWASTTAGDTITGKNFTMYTPGTGIADPGSGGILARTGTNTVTPRTITGTSNLITVTNGDGVSGNPTITVGSLVGQISRQTFSNADASVSGTNNLIAQTGTMSAARTLTLAAASAYAAGGRVTITDESGTVTPSFTVSIARAGSDTINGAATSIIYGTANFAITLESDGSSKWTIVSGTADVQTFDTAGTATWTKSNGAKEIFVIAFGAGGGGGGGGGDAAATVRVGGGGGGGGARVDRTLRAATVPSSVTVTIGTGGGGGTGGSSTFGIAGTSGGDSSFGAFVFAGGGGGGGRGNTATASVGGSGGGSAGTGIAGGTGGVTVAGGSPGTATANAIGGQGGQGSGGSTGGASGGLAEYGGAGGGGAGSSAAAVGNGGGSRYGAGAGGSGGGVTSGNARVSGAPGGASSAYASAGGGAGGAGSDGAAGTAGADASTNNTSAGYGGGGGAGAISGTGGLGGNGGFPGGGAGGGGAGTTTGGAGATGGGGRVVVTQIF